MLLSEELAIDSASKDYLTIAVCGPTISPPAAARGRYQWVSNVMTARYLGHSTGEQACDLLCGLRQEAELSISITSSHIVLISE